MCSRSWSKLSFNKLIKNNHLNILFFPASQLPAAPTPSPPPFDSLGPSSPTQRGFAYTTPCLVTGSIFMSLSWQILHILLCPPFSFPSVYSMPISDTTQLSPRQSCHRNGSTSKTNTHPRNTDGGKKTNYKLPTPKRAKISGLGPKIPVFWRN